MNTEGNLRVTGVDEELVEQQVVSKQRVADHGEVLTGRREVVAMLDLVRDEIDRIESRFLEPACGTGNFLVEVLERKLRVVEARYGRSQADFERYAVVAVSSIYGIDILEDSIKTCRAKLYAIFARVYERLFKDRASDRCRDVVRYLLRRNIIHGDALSLTTMETPTKPIVFSEWSPANGSLFKRRDYTFSHLMANAERPEHSLFSDFGERVFIPAPSKEFPLIHYLEVASLDGE